MKFQKHQNIEQIQENQDTKPDFHQAEQKIQREFFVKYIRKKSNSSVSISDRFSETFQISMMREQ